MYRRAGEYGSEMIRRGLKGPAPKLSFNEIASLVQAQEAKIFRIGRRRPEKVLLLVRKGFGTLYAKATYGGYRKAYMLVFPDSLTGRDIDHLAPRSTTSSRDTYIALGHIDLGVNRAHRAKHGAVDTVMKAMNENSSDVPRLTASPRPAELGRFVQNGYIRPFSELKSEHLRQIVINWERAVFEEVKQS